MSEEKIWVESDILLISLDTQENTDMVEQPDLCEPACEMVHRGQRASARDDDDEKDRLTGVTGKTITCETTQK